MAIGARRLTAFIRMYTTDTTPHALAKPNPAGPPAAAASDVFAAAPPDTRSAFPIIVLFGAAAMDDVEGAGCWSRACSRAAEDANAIDTEDGLRDEQLDHASHRGACTTKNDPPQKRERGGGGYISTHPDKGRLDYSVVPFICKQADYLQSGVRYVCKTQSQQRIPSSSSRIN